MTVRLSSDEYCTGCGTTKPDLGEITLASKKGWRLERRTVVSGTVTTLAFEWYCPACVARRKDER